VTPTNVFWIRPRRHNVGNETIAYALRGLLRAELGSDVNLLPVAATSGEYDGWLSGLTAQTVHQMNLYGHGVVVGGGNIYENGGLDVDVGALRELRPPLMLCSLSYGRIFDDHGQLRRRTDAMPKDVVRALGEQALTSVARDQATVSYLRELGLEGVGLGACPSLFVRPGALRPRSGSRGEVLVSIRNPQLMSVPLRHQARVASEVARLVETLREQDLGPVRLLCHDRRDMPFAAGFSDIDYTLPDDALDFLERLQSASLVVTFRLHAFLPSLALGVPAVNVSYDERSAGMMGTLGLEEWDVDFLTESDLTSTILDRAHRPQDLERLRTGCASGWRELEGTLHGAIRDFGAAVDRYAQESRPLPEVTVPA
jgi:polysaccharide pyruvyl transferase